MSHNRDLSAAAAQLGFHSSNIGIGTDTPGAILEVFHATSNTIVNVKSGDSGAVLNLIDDSARSSIEQIGTTLKISSDTGAEDASSDIRLQVDGSTKMTIDSSSRVLIGRTSTSHEHPLQVQAANGANAIAIQGRSADDQSEITFYENDNSTITAQIQQLSNRSIFRHRVGYMRFDTGGTSEKMRLDANGYLGLNNSAPHNQYYNNLVIGDGSASGDKGITIRTQSSNEGVIAFSDADSGAARYAGKIAYNHGTNAMMFFTSNGDERLRILSNGHVNIGGYLSSVSNSGLHVGRGSGGTAAGESVLAATLGNDSTMVSALLTVKNAGNRGTQGHASGSPLAKFEFNNGTAFEIDKYGRRTLQYQPAARLTIDTNSTGGGNHSQTGLTILPFNNTNRGYNTGNHFNTTNHTFTAPIAGKYLVIVSVNVIGDTILYIYKNGSAHSAGEFRSNPTGAWEHTEVSSVIEMSANDTIQAYSYLVTSSGGRKFNGGTNPGSVWDHMSIYFLG